MEGEASGSEEAWGELYCLGFELEERETAQWYLYALTGRVLLGNIMVRSRHLLEVVQGGHDVAEEVLARRFRARWYPGRLAKPPVSLPGVVRRR